MTCYLRHWAAWYMYGCNFIKPVVFFFFPLFCFSLPHAAQSQFQNEEAASGSPCASPRTWDKSFCSLGGTLWWYRYCTRTLAVHAVTAEWQWLGRCLKGAAARARCGGQGLALEFGKPGFVSRLHHSLISLALDDSLLHGDTRGTYLLHCREDLMSLVDKESLAVRGGVTVNRLFPFGPTCPRTSGKGVGVGTFPSSSSHEPSCLVLVWRFICP